MSVVVDRFRSFPRAVRWAIVAAGIFASYFLIVEPLLDARNTLVIKGDDKARQLAAAQHNSADVENAQTDLKTGITRFGTPELPGSPTERSEALTRRIASVLQAHGVRDHTSTVKESPLSAATLAATFGSDVRVDRLITELQFDASPETFMGVLADLEQSPEVAAVSRVSLRKAAAAPGGRPSSSRTLKASIAVEAWQLVRKGRAR